MVHGSTDTPAPSGRPEIEGGDMDDAANDATAPGTPELRAGPPWAMQEMMEAEPDLAERVAGPEATAAARAIAEAARRAVAAGDPVAVVGCGTSEHGAMAIGCLLTAALGGPGRVRGLVRSRQAFEAALEPWPGGLCLGVSHEGETAATNAALRAAGGVGAATALVTAAPGSPGAAAVGTVLATPMTDRSWCHTVGYLSPILAGAMVAAAAEGTSFDGAAAAALLREVAAAARPGAEAVVGGLAGADRYLLFGGGADRVPARELALKIEEGARRTATGRDLETVLHGHLAGCDERTALVGFVTDLRDGGRRARRAEQVLLAGRRVGMPTAAVLSAAADRSVSEEATGAGRIVVPDDSGLGPVPTSLLATAMALQHLALALVHQAGTNPDRIRREDPAYAGAAEVAGPFPGDD
jgi:glutamine---fructose-6-phosphate transaminase (isomerizing)